MKVRKNDVIWNYIGTFMSLGSNFLLLPFMMHYLNGEALGLWYVFLSIGGIVNLFDFGFNPTLARNVAYSWSGAVALSKTDAIFVANCEPNIGLLKKVILTCKRIYLIISVLALTILLTIGTVYILHLSNNMIGYTHIAAWIIYSFAVFLNIYYGYYTTFLRGVGAISKINIATVLSRTFQIILSIVLLHLGFGLVAVSLAYLGYGLLFRLISKNAFYKYENIGERIKNDRTIIVSDDIKETFFLVWHNAWRDGMVSLSRYLSNQASVIICSMYLSLTETGIYSISIQLITAIATISGALYTTFQPSLQSAYINNNIEKLKKLMSIAMTVYCTLFWIGVVALIFIGIPILEVIKPDVVFSIPILLVISLYQFLLKHHSYYASYISNTNNVPYMKSFILSSFIGIIISILLIRLTNMGVWGLIFAQIIVQGVYNNWMWPYKVMKSLNTDPVDMFKLSLQEIKRLSDEKIRYKETICKQRE
ncbi:O-unit flippase-like protein [Clostridium sediminicola]|uniref:O-unit flippase-like protein n=1 Tax=Clostridium sediminicola TaxID=3114879 RepID=UPI0031F1D2A5